MIYEIINHDNAEEYYFCHLGCAESFDAPGDLGSPTEVENHITLSFLKDDGCDFCGQKLIKANK